MRQAATTTSHCGNGIGASHAIATGAIMHEFLGISMSMLALLVILGRLVLFLFLGLVALVLAVLVTLLLSL
jgi:hypothetical protein